MKKLDTEAIRFICGTWRVGGTFMQRVLQNTKVCSVPREIPGNKENESHFDYKNRVFDFFSNIESTPNGVRCVKVSPDLLPVVPQDLFLRGKHIWLRRRDKIYQAISWARALQTDRWQKKKSDDKTYTPTDIETEIIYKRLTNLIGIIRHNEEKMLNIFEENKLSYMTLYYEDFTASEPQLRAIISKILAFFEIDEPIEYSVDTDITISRDDWTETLYKRYITEQKHKS